MYVYVHVVIPTPSNRHHRKHHDPNQTKPNQTKPNQTKPNQTKPNQTNLDQREALGGELDGLRREPAHGEAAHVHDGDDLGVDVRDEPRIQEFVQVDVVEEQVVDRDL